MSGGGRGIGSLGQRASSLPAGVVLDVRTDLLRLKQQREMWDYWNAARADAAVPTLSWIEPTGLPRTALPYLVLYAIEPGERVLVRLEGTEVVEVLGQNNRGRYVGDISGTEAQLPRLLHAAHERRPYWVETAVSFKHRDYRYYSALVLPFGDGGLVTRLLSVVGFE